MTNAPPPATGNGKASTREGKLAVTTLAQPASPLELHTALASSVIVHEVPQKSEPDFLEWQRGITRAAEAAPGYRRTEIYPPSGPASAPGS